ncbi:hypothetical protein [Streptomyces sp. NPDC054849]
MTTTYFRIDADSGPCLGYVHSDGKAITLADQQPVTDPRERAILRSLLQHAISLLDQTEPTSPAVRAGGAL